MTARMQQFEQLVAVDLPTLCADFGLSDEVRRVLNHYAEELQNWMSGILVWHQGCDRYDEATLLGQAVAPVKEYKLVGATGLGTSAARIHQRRPRQLSAANRLDGAL
jgi:germacradienol/geosmin synthase